MSWNDANTPLTWALTAAVIAVGGWRALPRDVAPEPPPAEASAPEVVDAPTATEDASNAAEDAAPDWRVAFAEDFSRLDRIVLSDVVELGPSGSSQTFQGKLWVWVDADTKLAFPVVDGAVTATLAPPLLARLARSRSLGLQFKGHPRTERPLPWLVELGKPTILASDPQPESTTMTVRNNSAAPTRLRLRAGWRDGPRWMDDPERGEAFAVRQELAMAPGEVREVTLTYTPSTTGALSPPQARILLD